tara:strand:- start:142 stop:858 length:717 start_codon:yes stop_codon:yes gene_type:complete
MKYNEIKLTIIKKVRDIYFLLRFGRGRFFFRYIYTYFCHLIFKKKFTFDFEKTIFSNKWFYQNISYINFLLKDKKKNINKILEIGSYEGQSAFFFLKYFVGAQITCVDIWQNQVHNYKNIEFKNIEKNFDENLDKYQERIIKFKGSSKNFFKKNSNKNFDLIFVDGSHYKYHVYQDAINSFKNLKINGYILFDDYLFKYKSKKNSHPLFAINKFLIKYKKKIKIIAIYRQVLIKKISD